ncbi:MAG: thioredoxin domain-containing protein [Dehalococcoidia bacterium]
MPNNLINESSPYLLQHANNPVEWHPWTAEALELSKSLNKPILLSIGYSACHWCHVMEQESFENVQIAELMNEHFINIKVDREERPDLDSIYMEAVQMMTGSGGWPMTMFLTPDLKPFFAGTYFPPESRHGMPGFNAVLISVADAFQNKAEEISKISEQITSQLQHNMSLISEDSILSEDILSTAVSTLSKNFDYQNGGFGNSPKFPQPMTLEFLLQYHKTYNDEKSLELVTKTLDCMMYGGIYDQIGGGFHRYSTDAYWLVPHFEKMLYDNALLIPLYLHAFLVTNAPKYKYVVEQTIQYIQRDMLHPDGGFFSSQDADSEGIEGKYFVWDINELRDILPTELFDEACEYYSITDNGNFEGQNILSVPGKKFSLEAEPDTPNDNIMQTNEIILSHRYHRIPPFKDDKIILAWNAMMLKGLSEAGSSLNNPDYLQLAINNAEFLLANLMSDTGELQRIWRNGTSKINGHLEDYALFADALLTLYESTLDEKYLEVSVQLTDKMILLFWDDQQNCFYDVSLNEPTILTRPRTVFDNAQPCGASVATKLLLKLCKVTGGSKYSAISEKSLRGMAPVLLRAPSAAGTWLCGLEMYLNSGQEFVITGELPEITDLLIAVHKYYLPNKVIVGEVNYVSELPILKGKTRYSGAPTAYMCENYVCNHPTTRVDELIEQILSSNSK